MPGVLVSVVQSLKSGKLLQWIYVSNWHSCRKSTLNTMDLKPFKLDIDELINEFVEGGSTTLVDMKRVWLSRKFSFIFEASPSTNLACFMQSLYSHTIGYMASTASLSHRLGGLFCLYCLHETQPFKPPFKIYLSLGELNSLKNIVVDAKKQKLQNIGVVAAVIKCMLEKKMFLFGFVDINEGSVTQRINELGEIQNARVKVAYRKLFENTKLEQFVHMDMGKEFEVDFLKESSTNYAVAKEFAVKEASEVVDVQNIKHIAEKKNLIGDLLEKTAQDWNAQKELFCQQTGLRRRSSPEPKKQNENEKSKRPRFSRNAPQNEASKNFILEGDDDDDDGSGHEEGENFGKELEDELLYQFEYDDEGSEG